jgi:uncharacterized protein (DUF2267 family)
MSRLSVLESTVQRTHEWLRDIKQGLGFDNDRAAYAALRGTLHALRDQLQTDEIAQLGAQLPLLVRGIYYESWNPKPATATRRVRTDFLSSIRHGLHDHPELRDTIKVAQTVLGVISAHVSPGEIDQVVHVLPAETRKLWLEAAFPQPSR